MAAVRRFFDKAPRFSELDRAMAKFARNDFHQPLTPANFLAFIEREAGDLDEDSMLEYCRNHLEYAGAWNLGIELEVRTCWRLACTLDHWQALIQGSGDGITTQQPDAESEAREEALAA
jgi:hypothetical protein